MAEEAEADNQNPGFLYKVKLKIKDLNSIKMMWNHTKPETLPPINRRVRCLCENIIIIIIIIIINFISRG